MPFEFIGVPLSVIVDDRGFRHIVVRLFEGEPVGVPNFGKILFYVEFNIDLIVVCAVIVICPKSGG